MSAFRTSLPRTRRVGAQQRAAAPSCRYGVRPDGVCNSASTCVTRHKTTWARARPTWARALPTWGQATTHVGTLPHAQARSRCARLHEARARCCTRAGHFAHVFSSEGGPPPSPRASAPQPGHARDTHPETTRLEHHGPRGELVRSSRRLAPSPCPDLYTGNNRADAGRSTCHLGRCVSRIAQRRP